MNQLAERLDPETLLERIDPQWRDHWMDPADALEYYKQAEPKRYARAVLTTRKARNDHHR